MTMITSTGSVVQVNAWQQLLSRAVRDVASLARALDLDLPDVPSDFPVLVPEPYLARIRPGDPRDPLLLQVLPREQENLRLPGYVKDPLQESGDPDTPAGLLHKYHGRVLVVTSGACAVHCRYCFRRHFPYQDEQPDSGQWQTLLQTIRDDASINEVILSGGDPLVMNDRQLARLAIRLSEIEHVNTLRIHTRLPVVIPERVCPDLLNWMTSTDLSVVVVTHINHPAEIDSSVDNAMAALRQAGVTLLNQSVLLKDVNNDAATLIALSRRLFQAGVLPYYLHLLDPVEGAAHFDVDETAGRELMKTLSASLPGYLVPRLVREEPGAPAKQLRF